VTHWSLLRLVFECFAVLPVLKILWKKYTLIAISSYSEFRCRTRMYATLLVISSVSLACGDKVNGFYTTLLLFLGYLTPVYVFQFFQPPFLKSVMFWSCQHKMYLFDISIVLKFCRLIIFTERNGAEVSFRACLFIEISCFRMVLVKIFSLPKLTDIMGFSCYRLLGCAYSAGGRFKFAWELVKVCLK